MVFWKQFSMFTLDDLFFAILRQNKEKGLPSSQSPRLNQKSKYAMKHHETFWSCLKVQRQIWDISQGVSSLTVRFTRKILAWYDK